MRAPGSCSCNLYLVTAGYLGTLAFRLFSRGEGHLYACVCAVVRGVQGRIGADSCSCNLYLSRSLSEYPPAKLCPLRYFQPDLSLSLRSGALSSATVPQVSSRMPPAARRAAAAGPPGPPPPRPAAARPPGPTPLGLVNVSAQSPGSGQQSAAAASMLSAAAALRGPGAAASAQSPGSEQQSAAAASPAASS